LSTRNEEKSTIRQAIIEIQTAAAVRNDDDLAAAAAQLLKKLDEKKMIQQEAERALKIKQYKQSSIDFSKVVLVERLPENFYRLSDPAKLMLYTLSRIPKYGNLVQISNDTLAVLMNKTEKQTRNIKKEILESGFLKVIEEGKKDSPTIYKVSDEIFAVGKKSFSKQDEKQLIYFNNTFEIVVSTSINGEKYTRLNLKGEKTDE